MHVLINALQAANRSGTGRYTVELVRALSALEVTLHITAAWPRLAAPPPPAPRLRVVPRGRNAVSRIFFDQIGCGRLRRRCDAELMHYPANFGPFRPDEGVVVTVHDLSFLRHPEWFRKCRAGYYRIAAQRSLPNAARLIADSEATARDIEDFLGIPSDNIDVVPLGVSNAFTPAPQESCQAVLKKYGLPSTFLLYVGTMEPRKNLPRLIRAWSRAAAHLPDLVIAGRAGWRTQPIREALLQTPHTARVHLPGFVGSADLPALLTAAHAFVWPSLFEGFGLPPLEAMACGTPVLTASTSSLPEVTGDAAVRVDPEEEEAISEGLKRITADTALRAALRQKGFARAGLFTWERTARMTLDTYARAID